MIAYGRYQSIVAQSDIAVQQAAAQAFSKLLEKIRQGQTPQRAITDILREFNADTLAGFREAFSAILGASLGMAEVKAWPVGGVTLSQRLYQNAQQVSATTRRIIEDHLKGLHNAQALRKALYEGYHFQSDPLDIIKPLPKYLQVEFDKFKAAQLKTPALRAAYLEAIAKAEAGAGMAAIEKRLRIAFYERNRYFANRIARTELHRAYTDQVAKELMEEEQIEYVQIRLSSKHPKTDICDRHAKLDAYGLGPGVYPKAEAPKPPFHPHCLPGDALITASGRITAVSKRWYDGDIAVITTATGQKLAATINHPILTPHGWIAIGALQIGQQVVCRVGGQGDVVGNDQHQNMPACIAEIADSFFGSSQVTTREVPLATEDFHGDGMAGQIAVIGADGELWNRLDAASNKAVKYNPFVFATDADTLLGERILDLRSKALGLSAYRRVSGFYPFSFEFWRRLIALELLRFAHRAKLNPFFQKTPFDDISTNLQFLSEAQDRASSRVFIDDVVGINVQSWHGLVYNLETEQGHYTSNNIITHNCYCLVAPRIDLFNAKPRFNPKAERAFLAKLDPKEARDIAGSWDKLKRAKGGQSLEAIYNEGKDPLYQWKRLGDFDPNPIPAQTTDTLPPSLPKPQFQPQATIKHAARYVTDNNLADFADYTGIKVDVANECNQSLFEHIRDFPELRPNQKFIGTAQAQTKLEYDLAVGRIFARLRAANPSSITDQQLLAHAKKITKRTKTSGGTYAQSWAHPDVKGVAINASWGNSPEKLNQSLQNDVATKWHPVGTDSVKAVMDHEFGHQMDDLLGIRSDPDVILEWQSLQGTIGNEVSRYAATKITEFVAEAWAEYRNNPNPRPVATKIGGIILSRYKTFVNNNSPKSP